MASFKSTFLIISLLLLLNFSKINSHVDRDEGTLDSSDLRTKGLILVKVWCLIILFAGTFAAGVLPNFCRRNETFLLLGTQFAGGVFLSTSLIHFLSDSNSIFSDILEGVDILGSIFAAAGYLLAMFGDCIVIYVTKRGEREARLPEVESGREVDNCVEEGVGAVDHNPGLVRTTSFWGTIFLILALCFHSVFDGITVGVAAKQRYAWGYLWTISLHRIFVAIAMGIAVLRMIPKRPFLLTAAYSFAFAITSSVGVGIGIALNSTTQGLTADSTYAISMGIASGVLIYVATDHLIAKGFKPQAQCAYGTPFFKFLAVLFGMAVVGVSLIFG